MQSLKEAKAISQGKLRPSRRFVVSPSDMKAAPTMVALRSARARDSKSTLMCCGGINGGIDRFSNSKVYIWRGFQAMM
jgi:hypothetical protein